MKEGIKANIDNKEKYKDYIILGVGEGGGIAGMDDISISRHRPVLEKIKKGAKYVSLDKVNFNHTHVFDPERQTPDKLLDGYINEAKTFRESSDIDRNFIVGDITKIPLSSSSINEVWIENVFGDPSAGIFYNEAFGEIFRVLKSGGELYLFENITPGISRREILRNLNFLASSGVLEFTLYEGKDLFDYMINVLGAKTEIADMSLRYYKTKTSENEYSHNHFLIVATKLKK